MIRDNLITKAEMDKRVTVMESSVMASANSWWGPGEGDWARGDFLGAFLCSSRLSAQQPEMLNTFSPSKIQGTMQSTFDEGQFLPGLTKHDKIQEKERGTRAMTYLRRLGTAGLLAALGRGEKDAARWGYFQHAKFNLAPPRAAEEMWACG